MLEAGAAAQLLAQVEIRERTGESCPERNPFFCFDWAADNYDRYVDPTLEHIVLVVVSVVAENSFGRTGTVSRTIAIAQSQAPTVDFAVSPSDPAPNQVVRFNASRSDPAP